MNENSLSSINPRQVAATSARFKRLSGPVQVNGGPGRTYDLERIPLLSAINCRITGVVTGAVIDFDTVGPFILRGTGTNKTKTEVTLGSIGALLEENEAMADGAVTWTNSAGPGGVLDVMVSIPMGALFDTNAISLAGNAGLQLQCPPVAGCTGVEYEISYETADALNNYALERVDQAVLLSAGGAVSCGIDVNTVLIIIGDATGGGATNPERVTVNLKGSGIFCDADVDTIRERYSRLLKFPVQSTRTFIPLVNPAYPQAGYGISGDIRFLRGVGTMNVTFLRLVKDLQNESLVDQDVSAERSSQASTLQASGETEAAITESPQLYAEAGSAAAASSAKVMTAANTSARIPAAVTVTTRRKGLLSGLLKR